ncbi:hypothetical protein HK105_208492 [Polyrhizophydium stewartii]|uniref:NADH dehydrogenase [ubiquinone] 1 beta subcomplex subunit 8, mitochondrial n=1 Tax=Polyrhizophydium stewartii TaxID=2732419 RepID=A0ABR4MXW6_9FUNG|nr:hypothetical protein HK105_007334 [Polyrhizophydium stewartii]
MIARSLVRAARLSRQPLPTPVGLRAYGSYIGEGTNPKLAPPERPEPVAATIWTNKHVKPAPPKAESNPDDLFYHPMYTPPLKNDTAVGPLIKPLHYPEFDQIKDYWTKTGIASYDSVYDLRLEKPQDSFIGDYPKITPQYSWIRDPYAYWDQQGRRDYGEILYDHDNFTDAWGFGPTYHWYIPVVTTSRVLGALAFGAGLLYLWNPAERAWIAEKDYPYDGLRVELGGDPNNEEDNWSAAHVYKI